MTYKEQWFVLKVGNNREDWAKDALTNCGINVFLPTQVTCDTKNHFDKTPKLLFPTILFAYSTKQNLNEVFRTQPDISRYVSYLRDLDAPKSDNSYAPLTVDDRILRNLQLACKTNFHIKSVTRDQCHSMSKRYYIVTRGFFQGVIGRQARALQQTRLIIEIPKVGLVATGYIPKPFMKEI